MRSVPKTFFEEQNRRSEDGSFVGLLQKQCCSVLGWLRLVGSLKLWDFFEKEPCERDDILQKRPIILWSLLLVATP